MLMLDARLEPSLLPAKASPHDARDIAKAQLQAEWVLDEDFIEGAMMMALDADAVSFDIFDTALTRLVDSPADAFAEMEARLAPSLGALAAGYGRLREKGEHDIRQRLFRDKGLEEITLEQIIDAVIATTPGLEPHRQTLIDTELAVERDILTAVPDILELARRLQAEGKPVLFVSDMYLPQEFLAQVLAGCGYADWAALFVSSATLTTKWSGRQWGTVMGALPQGASLLHIGDDDRADVRQPQSWGIATMLYTRARSERRFYADLTPQALPFSYHARATALRAKATGLTPPTAKDYWYQTGLVLGTMVLGSFTQWLGKRAQLHGLGHIQFCARDGYLMQKAWEAAGLGEKLGITDDYLHVARRPLNLACGYLESTPSRLAPALVEFLVDGFDVGNTVGLVLNRANLGSNPALVQAAQNELGPLETVLPSDKHVAVVRAFFQRHSDTVHDALRGDYDALSGYLAQKNFAAHKRVGLVDMGWHGSIQRSLTLMLRSAGVETDLVGFYYGLWPRALGNLYTAGIMEAAFASPYVALDDQVDVHSGVDVLEELHMAPHGSIWTYQNHDGQWSALASANPEETRQHRDITSHFQAGAVDGVRELFATGRLGQLNLDELNPQAARAAIAAYFTAPSPRDLEMMSQLGHCTSFDHAVFAPIITRDLPKSGGEADLLNVIGKEHWKIGAIKHWFVNGSPTEREILRKIVLGSPKLFGERRQIQFY